VFYIIVSDKLMTLPSSATVDVVYTLEQHSLNFTVE